MWIDGRRIAKIVIVALTIIGGVWPIVTGGSRTAVAIMVLTTLVLAAVTVGPLGRFLTRAIFSLLDRIAGWTALR